ncbi:MAG: aminotransferase class III-fold pyridoxal phosphate-dependent enzyme [Candidatus Margulisbacteria bacterium]|nr:aminotransferase class III-fold pyridoxal phosphate-dependent enzyme [Candidatus Margulisiibacteriota bacterium]MBU1616722.1 aminotransferase class III-fold pyridoxal phosphate-dependent enzyme [Candidatus Margulisiibacteriota bacterium]MBU1867405.1 aminotransferase class III-fold pyridoxal phosphate-dependent enzyme [Candidatus Margulisiibacteriota bacterium]
MNKLEKRGKSVLPPVLAKYFADFAVSKGKGSYVYDERGKKTLDFATGIACNIIGHCPPSVVSAAKKQLDQLIHACIGVALYEPYIQLGEELQKIVPIKKAQSFFCQSGAEAVEAAIKLAKYAAKKPGIIAFQGGFHGRTLGALSVTSSKMKYREGYEPLLPEVYISPFDLLLVEGLLKENDWKIGSVIIEPILGEGGYLPLPSGFLRGVRALCDKYNTLLIVDEVQTGMGHTGKWFACEHEGVVPDIMVLAKGLASGLPLGACIASRELMAKWPAGAHGSTFGGNPVCCAAAIATIGTIKKEKLLSNTVKLGQYLMKSLTSLQASFPAIKEVRGQGLLIGVDLGNNTQARKVLDYCLDHGLLLISTGRDGTVIRFIPPLNVSKKEIDLALKIFSAALRNV